MLYDDGPVIFCQLALVNDWLVVKHFQDGLLPYGWLIAFNGVGTVFSPRHLYHGSVVGGDDRTSAVECLELWHAKPFHQGGRDKTVGYVVELRQFVIGHIAAEDDGIAGVVCILDYFSKVRVFPPFSSYDNQLNVVLTIELRHQTEKEREILPWLQ